MSITVKGIKSVVNMFDDLKDMPEDVMKDAFRFYKNKTPIDKGNARRNTFVRKLELQSKYPYAGRLDEGYSKQAPNGFTEPTIDKIDSLIDKEVRKIGR